MIISKIIGARTDVPVIIFLALSTLFLEAVSAQSVPPDSDAKFINTQEYRMPDSASAAGIDGTVTMGLSVDKTGKVKAVRIFGGPAWPCDSKPKKEIDEVLRSVGEYIAASRFSPAIKKGKHVDSSLILSFALGNAYQNAMKLKDAESASLERSPSPKIVEAGFINGKALSLPPPDYPSAARSQRIAGSIPVHVVFDEEGRVFLAGALSGHPLLQASAREAACRVKFAPVVLSGKPVKVTGTMTYVFSPQ